MHRWSHLFIPTLREAPADAEVASHKFLVRAGYIRQLAAGVYSFLFLGQRAMLNITSIVREEMDRIGQEFHLPALHPREIWEPSGRWQAMGENMFRLKDRSGRDLCLGMTAEEVMTEIARKELRSYKQLPQIWYQIQQKFRDEPRPKSGLLRVRQFTMKDSYSFDLDAAGLDVSYQKHYETYCRIFNRCGLKYVAVEAHSGAMGGSQSHEFMVYTDAGEDLVANCGECGYAANLDKATSKLEPVDDLAPSGSGEPELVHTPGQKTIEDVARFLGVSPRNISKTLAYIMNEATNPKTAEVRTRSLVVLMRGDHMLNAAKLSAAVGGKEFRPMTEDEIRDLFHSPAGYLGPLHVERAEDAADTTRPLLLVEEALRGRRNFIAGANKEEYHVKNITPGETFHPTAWADLRTAAEGEGCPRCGSPLRIGKAMEIGHIFKLGYKYSESMGASVLDEHGKEVTPIMGSYGIGIERILTASLEQNHDEDGFWLPAGIAPFDIVLSPLSATGELLDATVKIGTDLERSGFKVLLDDRDERPGVKFKDADLIGVPYRITMGSKKFSEGKVEVLVRQTKQKEDAAIEAVVEYMHDLAGR
ncbi:MAG TPA: proline--tRNA ligase [Terriglobales bacterium]|nr:proline--tRNA ligase [Terriglobales bacterium]